MANGTAFEVFLEGAEFPDPEAEEAALTEEEADRVEEAEAEDPRGEVRERRREEGASTSRPSLRTRPRPSRPPQRRATTPTPCRRLPSEEERVG